MPPAPGRSRGDAFDPNQNPNAPGAPQALGGGQLPIPADGGVGAPGGRGAGEPLDLANTAPRNPAGALPPQRNPGAGAGLTTLPPSATTLGSMADAEPASRRRGALNDAPRSSLAVNQISSRDVDSVGGTTCCHVT